jgi:hypothetical protein
MLRSEDSFVDRQCPLEVPARSVKVTTIPQNTP